MGKGKRQSKHSYMKKTIALCVVYLTIYTLWQMYTFQTTGQEASTLTQWVFTFWGIEVALLMIKRVMEDKNKKSSDCDESE